MTTEEGNAYIAKFIGIKQKSDGKTFELSGELQKILKQKTTQHINFNESLDLLYIALKKICSIKDLFCTTQQFQGYGCYVYLSYKAQFVEGEWRNAKFSCERSKSVDKFKQALWEVISSFCGWYYNNPDCQSEMEYELEYIKFEESQQMIYMKPKEVICPECKSIYEENKIKEEG